MSGHSFTRRFSVVADMRRRWSDEEKQAIVAEACWPGANISAVARRHGIEPSLLFRWRRTARNGGTVKTNKPAFLPVTVTAVPVDPDDSDHAAFSKPHPAPYDADSRIEIELGNGRRVRVGAEFDAGTLKRVLDILEGR